MGLKIKMLKEDLNGFNQDSNVIINGKDVVAIISLSDGSIHLSSERKIAECKKCGYAVYKLPIYNGGEYCGFCPECNCNKTEFEIIKK